jgi:hypothetical protein
MKVPSAELLEAQRAFKESAASPEARLLGLKVGSVSESEHHTATKESIAPPRIESKQARVRAWCKEWMCELDLDESDCGSDKDDEDEDEDDDGGGIAISGLPA